MPKTAKIALVIIGCVLLLLGIVLAGVILMKNSNESIYNEQANNSVVEQNENNSDIADLSNGIDIDRSGVPTEDNLELGEKEMPDNGNLLYQQNESIENNATDRENYVNDTEHQYENVVTDINSVFNTPILLASDWGFVSASIPFVLDTDDNAIKIAKDTNSFEFLTCYNKYADPQILDFTTIYSSEQYSLHNLIIDVLTYDYVQIDASGQPMEDHREQLNVRVALDSEGKLAYLNISPV